MSVLGSDKLWTRDERYCAERDSGSIAVKQKTAISGASLD
jgi:hypothetical protein